MSIKLFLIILVLSVIITYGVALVGFGLNFTNGKAGIPFAFSEFNFFGAETDNVMLTLDIIFWFLVVFTLWKLFVKFFRKN